MNLWQPIYVGHFAVMLVEVSILGVRQVASILVFLQDFGEFTNAITNASDCQICSIRVILLCACLSRPWRNIPPEEHY